MDYKILCLDGGGSKGIYSIGVLSELEKALGCKISEYFNLIYGTSTGAIIASMLALGFGVNEIKDHYLKLVPQIMGSRGQKRKSRKLRQLGEEIFGGKMPGDFKTDVGIVAMNYETQEPVVFKTDVERAAGVTKSFVPFFGVSILDAIEASTAACPVFCKKVLDNTNKGKIVAIDGGFIANNPTMFALIDAKHILKLADSQIKVLSIGVGNYIEKPLGIKHTLFNLFEIGQLFSKVLVASSNTIEVECRLLFPDIDTIRINDMFNQPQYGTNMVETDPGKLETMFSFGIRSYAVHETELLKTFNLT